MTEPNPPKARTYNGLHEVALRCLVSLHAFAPRGLSGTELRLVEFFAVFGKDVGLDRSLQYPHEGRGNAHGLRLDMIVEALRYLVDIGLVVNNGGEDDVDTGCDWVKIVPSKTDLSALLADPYFSEFARVCAHMRAEATRAGRGRYLNGLRKRLATLKQPGIGSPPRDPAFNWLAVNYALDAVRMRGLAHGAAFLAGFDPARHDEAMAVARAAEAEIRKVGGEAAGLDRLRADLKTATAA